MGDAKRDIISAPSLQDEANITQLHAASSSVVHAFDGSGQGMVDARV